MLLFKQSGGLKDKRFAQSKVPAAAGAHPPYSDMAAVTAMGTFNRISSQQNTQ